MFVFPQALSNYESRSFLALLTTTNHRASQASPVSNYSSCPSGCLPHRHLPRQPFCTISQWIHHPHSCQCVHLWDTRLNITHITRHVRKKSNLAFQTSTQQFRKDWDDTRTTIASLCRVPLDQRSPNYSLVLFLFNYRRQSLCCLLECSDRGNKGNKSNCCISICIKPSIRL